MGTSAEFGKILKQVETVCPRRNTVVLMGESGTGKEMFARYIHEHSLRSDKAFIPVDCTNLTGSLMASQLFGHVRGAFTGADRDTLGFFRAADQGTIFLDEIGDLHLDMQARLLRVLQESAVTPVGATHSHPIDVRVLCATHRDLQQMVRAGTFRQDLYYRLNVVTVRIPALRDRPEDIAPLAEHFLDQQANLYDEPCKELTAEAEQVLLAYHWPGNVRELANAMEHAHIFSRDCLITSDVLPEAIRFGAREQVVKHREIPTLYEANRDLVIRALQQTGGRRIAAANLLGIERRRLNRMISGYQIDLEAIGQPC